MNNVRTDCFAYNKEQDDCSAFTEMFCKYKECKFFKEAPIKKAIDREIREYPLRARKEKDT